MNRDPARCPIDCETRCGPKSCTCPPCACPRHATARAHVRRAWQERADIIRAAVARARLLIEREKLVDDRPAQLELGQET